MSLQNTIITFEYYYPGSRKSGRCTANEPVAGRGYFFIPRFLLLFISVLLSFHAAGANNTGEPVTLAGFGQRVVPAMKTDGDTWDGAWLANGKVYLQHNDGRGFMMGKRRHDGIGELIGTPAEPSSISGINLNPGELGDFLGKKYSSGIYEVDGVLYHNVCYSRQWPGNWQFFNYSIIKSTDGGANWINHLGEINTNLPNKKSHSLFPGALWPQLNFVKYGKGGSAPDIDNAKTYVYLGYGASGGYYLNRIKRSDLPLLDKKKFQCYTGGDGMLDNNWTNDMSRCSPITTKSGKYPYTIVYNYGLKRYLSVYFRSDAFSKPPVESSLGILEAPHPWGPWTRVLEENVNHKEGDNLTWSYLLQKFTSDDGKKMWMTVNGTKPYGLQFLPVYLTTHPVQSYEAEDTMLTGTRVEKLHDSKRRSQKTADYTLLKIDQLSDSELELQIQKLSETLDKLLVKYTDKHPDVKAVRQEMEELRERKAKAGSRAKEIKLHAKEGYSGSGYVTGFDAAGDQCLFNVNVKESGAYILNLRYNTSQYQTIDIVINGIHREKLKLGKSEQKYATWTEMSVFSWLEKGDNTVAFKSGTAQEAEVFNLDRLSLAFYSNIPESLPNCSPSTK